VTDTRRPAPELPAVRWSAPAGPALLALFALLHTTAQYLLQAKGWHPAAAGLGVLPLALGLHAVAGRNAAMARVLGERPLITAGALLLACALLLMSTARAHTPYALYCLCLALAGVGAGMCAPPLAAVVGATPAGPEPGPTPARTGPVRTGFPRHLGPVLGLLVPGAVLAAAPASPPPSARAALGGPAASAPDAAGPPIMSIVDSQVAAAAVTDGMRVAFTAGAAVLIAFSLLHALLHRGDPGPSRP